MWAMEKSPILRELTKMQLEKIADNMRIVNYKKGDVVFKADEVISQRMVVLHEGALKEALLLKFRLILSTILL